MRSRHWIWIRCSACMASLLLTLGTTEAALGKGKQEQEHGIYSPIIQVEPKKGFLLVTKDSNVIWVEASSEAKPHLHKLPVGEMLDMVVTNREGKRPPLLTRWKLASGESSCKQFDGKRCR